MINLFIILVLISGCSSAPRPSQVSLTGKVDPVNFHATSIKNTVIKSQQAQGHWHKRFVYKIDHPNPSPEFFYAVAHADRIIANIKPPTHFIFKKLQADLRRYGIATPVELFVVEDIDGQPQIVLECIKFGNEQ